MNTYVSGKSSMSLFRQLNEFPESTLQWLWRHFISLSGVTLLESFPGCYKTSIFCDLAARITTGRPMPLSIDAQPPGSVAILNAEDSRESLMTRLKLAGADITRIAVPDPKAGFRPTFPNCLHDLARLAGDGQLRLIVIDPLASFAAAPITSDVPTRRMMDALTRFSQQFNVAIVCIRHWTKVATPDPTYRGAGSHCITAAARSALIVGKCTSNSQLLVLAQLKNNLAPLATSIEFEAIAHPDGVTINWLGESQLTANELLSAPSQRERPAIEEAKRLLIGLLGEGALSAKLVRTKATDAGISTATLRRAKEELFIASRRRGFGPASVVFWELPPASHPAVAPYWAGEIDHLAKQLFYGNDARGLAISPPSQTQQPKPRDEGDAEAAV